MDASKSLVGDAAIEMTARTAGKWLVCADRKELRISCARGEAR